MRDLNNYGRQCVKDLEAIGYSIPNITWNVNGRLSKTWGYCRTKRRNGKTYAVSIDIAKFLLENDASEKTLRQVIYHELAHAIDDNKHGHGTEWKAIANMISDCYNMNIQQYVTKEEHESMKNCEAYQKINDAKWILTCPNCGTSYKFTRVPKWLNKYGYTHSKDNKIIINGCICSKCKAKLEITKYAHLNFSHGYEGL